MKRTDRVKKTADFSRAAVAGLAIVIAAATILSCEPQEERTMLFFYEAVCPSCEESQRMEALAGRVATLAATVPNMSSEGYDIYHSNGIEILEEKLVELDKDLTSISFPILYLDGEIYEGEDTIVAKLEEIREQAKR